MSHQNTVLNLQKFDVAKQTMFFGDKAGVARYDLIKYQIFDKLDRTQKSFFWNPEEINLEKDRDDFQNLAPHEQHIFAKNIAYQILLDSIQERGPLHFLPWVSLPELEAAIITWSFFEQIHAKSYQHILQNAVPDPSIIFDSITEDENIIARAKGIIKYYDDFIQYSEQYRVLGPGKHEVKGPLMTVEYDLNMRELKRRLYLALISVYALESIRFYVSFACSFAFGQQSKMRGNADIIRLIAKDESQHQGITLAILRNLKKDDPEFVQIIAEEEENALRIFDECVAEEKDWAKYLFKDGSLVGMNETLLCKDVEAYGNKRIKALGFPRRYEATVSPFGWMSTWLSSDDSQVAPQEKEVTDYLLNVMDTRVNESNLLDL
jgi:ribonucleoside-diphosphate reductase beta chain